MSKRRHLEDQDEKPAKLPKTLHERETDRRVIVVLEKASLETVKVGTKFELLNCDDHKPQLKKLGREPGEARPDITHQCLMMLLDSPLNRAGRLQVYIHTTRNVLIEINPHTRLPRTFSRFCGLMVQLLHKLSIHASDGPHKLLKVIKNPVTDHLPTKCPRILMSFAADECVHPHHMVPADSPVVFVIGAMAHGKVEIDYATREASVSEYPLSAAIACTKVCCAAELKWGIL
ncbi:ribosomal RNA small subunit methyltransferase NEP1-like [Sycon ciliatum]|uniref:ribosomal RNA small subunit methyltransferase NEP1-like n=1 Tax=Sycon ciliatum TaxID=27933 RepID=UPI0020AEE036|eukprot:scpid90851/ scgid11808/ Ribosomal RNA small subunit methyltransferase NEP1; 18S rRNA (pseudouridine-N1-)-methyltransferase NEP1; Nucleolar protein EMG1 homolog; Protein C2f; Ribosome biogenesis protein NEP1